MTAPNEVAGRLSESMANVHMLAVGLAGVLYFGRCAPPRMQTAADIVSYTDVDLLTELEAVPRLFGSLIEW